MNRNYREPDLTTVSLGAGVQSSAIVEMIVEGDLPLVDVVIFADTGDEPQYVYDQVDYLRGRLELIGIPLDSVQKSNMVEDLYTPGRFAALPLFIVQKKEISGFGKTSEEVKLGKGKRQCTHEYKIEPIERRIREILVDRGFATKRTYMYVTRGTIVESWLGISLDEAERIKPSRTKWLKHQWPLIDKKMSRLDCINWLQDHNLPIPQKSSCIRCPYHSNTYWLDMRENRPEDWEKVLDFDTDLRNGRLRLTEAMKGTLYLHSTCIPLGDVKLNGQEDQMAFNFCDAGYCWT